MFNGVTYVVVPDDQKKPNAAVPDKVLSRLGKGDIIIEGGRGWVRASTWEHVKAKLQPARARA